MGWWPRGWEETSIGHFSRISNNVLQCLEITEKPCLFQRIRAILQTKIFSRTELPHRLQRKSTSHLTVH